MALQISEYQGIFSVHGVLNGGNAKILKQHMSRFINPNRSVILNLERVEQIDECAAHMLRQLYVFAMKSNSVLSIIGEKNLNILPVLKETKTDYILSDDRI